MSDADLDIAEHLLTSYRLWDGLTTASDTRILVLGATNRPNEIDPAILRRMPKRFPIRLPNLDQRTKILTLMLNHTSLASTFSLAELARRTDGLSGSDLRETCRNAAMAPVREVMREKGGKGKEGLEKARLEVSYLPEKSAAEEYQLINVRVSSSGRWK